MTESHYAPERTASFYDEYGDREWRRFDRGIMDKVALEIHRRFLRKWIEKGQHVLEVGPGPGRFTIELANVVGVAKITTVDVSAKQIELHREKMAEVGLEHLVEARHNLDVANMSSLPDHSFDAATAYGGPLSYVFDRAGDAIDELVRVVRPGGVILFSVMSRWGTIKAFFGSILDLDQKGFRAANDGIVANGDLVGDIARIEGVSLPHECHMFTWPELRDLIAARGCEVVDASAANYLSIGNQERLAEIVSDPERWGRVLDWEEQACRSAGALDGGTHILVAIRQTGGK